MELEMVFKAFPYGLKEGLFPIMARRAPITPAVNRAITAVLLHMEDQ